MLTGFRQQHSLIADEDRFWSQQGHLLNGQHLEREHNCKALWRTWLGIRCYLQELYSLYLVSSAPLVHILALSSFSSCNFSVFFHMSPKFRNQPLAELHNISWHDFLIIVEEIMRKPIFCRKLWVFLIIWNFLIFGKPQ